MILFVDETETNEYFIVTGLLLNNEYETNGVYKKFKKYVNSLSLIQKDKVTLFREFKSTLMDRRFQRIKLKLLDEINNIDNRVIYTTYIKKNHPILQGVKEKEYIRLITRIIESIDLEIDIVFDGFNKKDFESKIIDKLNKLENVKSVRAGDSQKECGLQFADNMCGVIRLHLTNKDEWNFYKRIEKNVIKL
ncbi:MAG: DUF3800 domain-containing protein [Erysipelotrichaceae bacterium]|nr:DUF3800 domain-containing protein [Erysipelotrichaceae bacterium]